MPRQIITEKCSRCGACVNACPVEAIKNTDNRIQINPDECIDCAACWRVCPECCIDGGPHKYLNLKERK